MNIPVYGQNYREMGAIAQPLKVSANLVPDMHVRINEGSAWIGGEMVEYAGGQSQTLVAPTIGTYIAVIALRASQIITLYGEIAANNPALPNIPDDSVPLAAILLNSASYQISNDMIQDIRPFVSTVTTITDHNKLENLNADNIHPINAITGLQEALDKKLEAQDVETKLNDVATSTGTPSNSFTINKGSVGVPTASSELIFARGALGNAGIRFNESTDVLEYNNGSGAWIAFGEGSNSADPFNQENIYWKADIDRMVAELNTAIKLKATSARVEELANSLANIATVDYVNNQFLNLYSKQDLDSIVKKMTEALAKINNKVDNDSVYSKAESDQANQELEQLIDTKADQVLTDANSNINAKIDELDPKFEELENKVNAAVDNVQEQLTVAKQEIANSVDEQIDTAKSDFHASLAEAKQIASESQAKIAQNNADTLAAYSTLAGNLQSKFDAKVKEIEDQHVEFEAVIQQVSEDFAELKTNTENSVDDITARIDTAETDIDELDTVKADKANTYTKDEVYAKAETYSQSEVDSNIESAINDTLNTINTSLNEVLGNEEGGGSADESSLANTLAQTAKLIVDVKTKIDNERKEAIAEIHEQTIEDVKSEIIDQVGMDDLSELATKTDIDTLNTDISNKISALTETVTENDAKSTAADETLQSNIDNAIQAAAEDLTDAVNTINTTIDEKISVTNDKIAELQSSINTSVNGLESAYKAADTAIENKYDIVVSGLNATLTAKADASDTYTKSEVDQKFEEKDMTEDVYVKDEINALLEDKASIRDVYKYVESQVNTLIENKQFDILGFIPEDTANKNQANGYAGLDANGKVSLNAIPDLSIQKTYVVANEAARRGITGMISGAKAFETSTGNSYIYDGTSWLLMADANWANVNLDFNNIANAPTTIGGYGITDAYTKNEADSRFAANSHTHSVDDIETDLNHMFVTADQIRSLNGKADLSAVYTQESADSLFVKKLDLNTTLSAYTNTVNMNAAIKTATDPLAKASTVYTKTEVDNLLTNKANNTDIDTVKSTINNVKSSLESADSTIDGKIIALEASTNNNINTINGQINSINTNVANISGDIVSVNTKFADYSTTEEINEILEDYAKTADVNTAITNAVKTASDAINEDLDDTNQAIRDANTAISNVDTKASNIETKFDGEVESINGDIEDLQKSVDDINTALENYAKTTEVETAITNAVDDINTTLEDYAKSTDVTEEIKTTVDSSIAAALESVNNALSDAVGNDSGSGNDLDVNALINNTASLITQLNENTESKINTVTETLTTFVTETKETILTEVKTEIVEQVITEKIQIDDLDNLATKAGVAADIKTASDALDEKITAVDTKANNLNTAKQDKLGYTAEDTANKNQANGYAGLDANGKVSLDAIPDLSIQKTYVVADLEARNALTGMISGAKAFVTGIGNSYIYNGTEWLLMADADWKNVNLDFNNITNAPTTISGYGITDAYTKNEIDNAISSAVDTSAQAINATITGKEATLNGTISALANNVYTKSDIDSKFTAANANVATNANDITAIKTDIADIKGDIATNAGDITVIKSSLSVDEGNISTAQNDITAIKGRLDTAESNISDAQDDITDIKQDISGINTTLGTLAIADNVYTKQAVDDIFDEKDETVSGISARVGTLETTITTKANADDVYTQNEVDSALQAKDTAISGVSTRVSTLETTIATKANADDVYTKTAANALLDAKETVTNVAALATRVGVNETNISTAQGDITDIKQDISDIQGDITDINTAAESYAIAETVNTALAKKVDHDEIFNNSNVFETIKELDNGNWGKIFNEMDGGGTQSYNATHDVISYVGVNTDGVDKTGTNPDQAINVQIYSKFKSNKVGTLDSGVRINVNTEAAYYTKGTTKANTANREIAVLADVNAVNDLVAALTLRVNALETELAGLKSRIEALEA